MSKAFTPRRVEQLRPRLEAAVDDLIEALRSAVEKNPKSERANLYLAGAAYLTALWVGEEPNSDLVGILNRG